MSMIIQFLTNGLIYGALIAIMAISFWFIYRATSIFHIAHGAVFTICSYVFYTFYTLLGWNLLVSAVVSLVFTALLGVSMYYLIYSKLEEKDASQEVKFISSLGVYILIVNLIALLYGNETKVVSHKISESYVIGSVIIAKIQLIQFLSFLGVLIFTRVFLVKAKAGKLIRAIGDNSLLFKSLGLNEKAVKFMVFAIGSGIAGFCAILFAMDVGIDPYMGMNALLTAVVALILGGVKKIKGVVLGALMLGILQNLFVWKFSAQWEPAVTFLVLAIVLLYNSGGLIVVKKRVEEI